MHITVGMKVKFFNSDTENCVFLKLNIPPTLVVLQVLLILYYTVNKVVPSPLIEIPKTTTKEI